jgi:hypothetical protein
MRYFHLLFVLLTAACAPARQTFRPPDACSRERFQTATPYDSSRWDALEGAFRIIEVDTVNGRVTEVDLLRLEIPDSATRAAFIKPRAQLRQGRVELDSTPRPIPKLVGAARVTPNGPLEPNWQAFATGYFGVGCLPSMICLDYSPTVYKATYQSAAGVFGEWSNAMIGIVRLYDPQAKRELPAPAGFFCAIRRAAA